LAIRDSDHGQLLRLLVIIGVAAGAFFGTRAFAESTREMRRQDARRWFAEGQAALASGNVALAIDRLRRAVSRNPEQTQYSLTLAAALSVDGQDAAAEDILSNLRDEAPEDPEINLQLARLEARRGDPAAARRYYESSINALWLPEQIDTRRSTRIELIRFLLARGDTKRALSELMTLSANLTGDRSAEQKAGRLFLDAGDPAHARELYGRLLAEDPANADANAGAGEAAFKMGDYAAARQHLDALPSRTAAQQDMLDVTDAVLSGDPLAPRISAAERRRRLEAAFSRANERIAACGASVTAPEGFDDWQKTLDRRRTLDPNDIEEALDLIMRAERATDRCAPSTAIDRALAIVARRRGIDAQ
jgi:Tfp pilus assembly protein PilF